MTAMVLKRRLFEIVYEPNFMDLSEKECVNVDPNIRLEKRKKQWRRKTHLASKVPVEHGMDSEVNWSHETGSGERSEISDHFCNENKNLSPQKDNSKLKQKKHKHKEGVINSGASRNVHEVPATTNEADAGINCNENKNMYTHKESSSLKRKKHKHKERDVNTHGNRPSYEIPAAANGEDSDISNKESRTLCIHTGSSHLNQRKNKHMESNATCLAQSDHEFTCATCFKNFDDHSEFINHILLHREEDLFSCTSRKKLHRKDRLASEAVVVHSKESKVHKRNDDENKNLYKKKHKHKNCNVDTRDGMASHEISVPAGVEQLKRYTEENNIPCTQEERLQVKQKKKKKKEHKVDSGESIVSHQIVVNTNEQQPENSNEGNMIMCTEEDSLHFKCKKQNHKERKVDTRGSTEAQEVPRTMNGEEAESVSEENNYRCTQKDSLQVKQKVKKKKKERKVNSGESIVSHQIVVNTNEEQPENSNEENMIMCTEENSLHLKRKKQNHKERKVNTGECTASHELLGTANGEEAESANKENYYLYTQKHSLQMKQKMKKKKECKVTTGKSIVLHEIPVTTTEENMNMCTKEESLHLKYKNKDKKVNLGDIHKAPVTVNGELLESRNEENYPCTQKDSFLVKWKKNKKKHLNVDTGESIVLDKLLVSTNEEQPESSNEENMVMCTKEDSLYLTRKKQNLEERKINTRNSTALHEVQGTGGEEAEIGNEENYYQCTLKDSLQVKQKVKKKKKERKVNTGKSIVSHEILVTTNEKLKSNHDKNKNMCTEDDSLHLKYKKHQSKDRKDNIGDSMPSHEIPVRRNGEQPVNWSEENIIVCTEDSLHLKYRKKNHKDRKVDTGDSTAHEVLGTTNTEKAETGNKENYYPCTQKDSSSVKGKKRRKKEHMINTGESNVSHKISVTPSEEQPQCSNEEKEYECTEEGSLNLKQKEIEVNSAAIMSSHETQVTLNVEIQGSCVKENENLPIQKDSLCVTQKKQKHEDSLVNTGGGLLSREVPLDTLVAELDQSSEENKNKCTQDDILNLNQKKNKECSVSSGCSRMSHEIPMTVENREESQWSHEGNQHNLCMKKDISDLMLIEHKHKESKAIYLARLLQESLLITKSEHEFTCPMCFKNFGNRSNFIRHLLIHRDVKDFSCAVCEKSFRTKRSLQVHMRTHMKKNPQKNQKYQEEDVTTGCSRKSHEMPATAREEEPRGSNEENETLSTHDQILNCNQEKQGHRECNVSTGSSTMLHETTITAHDGQSDESNEENENLSTQNHILNSNLGKQGHSVCNVSPGNSRMSYKIPVTLGKKEESDSINKDNMQDLCAQKNISDREPIGLKHKESKSIYLAKSLYKSLSLTKSEHEFVCPTCFKNFNNRPNFVRHLLIHRDVKDFSCYVCDKSFRTKQNLKVHMRIHMEEKPFKCTECSACFSDANNLRRHVLIHNKSKEFVCDICSKTFSMKHHLQKHILSHEDLKLFPCPHCSKVFNYESRLRIHLETCKKLNPIICSICSKQFPRMYNLNRHMSTHE